MFCPRCGQKVGQDMEYCPHCGEKLPILGADPLGLSNEKAEPAEPAEAPEEAVFYSLTLEPEISEAQNADAPETKAEQETEAPTATAEAEEAPKAAEAAADSTLAAPVSERTAEGTEPAQRAEVPASDPQKKKGTPLALLAGSIIVLLAVVVVCLGIALSKANQQSDDSTGDVVSASELAETVVKEVDPDALAVTVQDPDGEELAALTNQQFCFYYWGEYFYYINYYGYSFDASESLDSQIYQETTEDSTGETVVTTWEDYFMESARMSILQVVALKAEAETAGFTMPDDYQSEYDSVVESMASNALSAGFTDSDGNGDALAYIQDSYGDSATLENFEAYLYDSYFVSAYSEEVYNSFTYTDEEIEQYYADNEETLTSYGIEKSDLPNVNVRHILIEPETDDDGNITDEAWTAAEEKAEEILAEWQAGEATEESFGTLAETYSADTGSNTSGGLYEDVYPGEMVTEFNDWCFDESRQSGDTAIIQTDYGYHVMYFVSFTDTYYYMTVTENELRYEDYSEYLDNLMDTYTAVLQDTVAVAEPNAVQEIREQYESQSTTTDTTEDTSGSSVG